MWCQKDCECDSVKVKEKRRRAGGFFNILFQVGSTDRPHQHHLRACWKHRNSGPTQSCEQDSEFEHCRRFIQPGLWSTALAMIDNLCMEGVSLGSSSTHMWMTYRKEEVLGNLESNKEKSWLRGRLGMLEKNKLHTSQFAKDWLWAPAFVVEAKRNSSQLCSFK